MTQEHGNYLLGSLEKAYIETRNSAETARVVQKTQQLVAAIVEIIDKSTRTTSDNTQAERGSFLEGETLTVTVAELEYGGLIKLGETAVTKATDWLPQGQKTVDGSKVDFQVRFEKVDFVKLENDLPQSRLGPIVIRGRFLDNNGITADFPLASFLPNNETGEMKLLYNFGNEIPGDSEDFREVERIVQTAKERTDQNVPELDLTETTPAKFEETTFPISAKVEGLGRAEVLLGDKTVRRDIEFPTDHNEDRFRYLHSKHRPNLIRSYLPGVIKGFRIKANLRQCDLGQYVGRSQALISAIENESDEARIDIDVALRIAYLFGQDVSLIVSDPTEITLIKQRAKEVISR